MTALVLAIAIAQVLIGSAFTIACLRLSPPDTRLRDLCERWSREGDLDDFADRWRDFGAQCHVHGWFKG